jgi:hypothetical protein
VGWNRKDFAKAVSHLYLPIQSPHTLSLLFFFQFLNSTRIFLYIGKSVCHHLQKILGITMDEKFKFVNLKKAVKIINFFKDQFKIFGIRL